jgi:hypothetical protein
MKRDQEKISDPLDIRCQLLLCCRPHFSPPQHLRSQRLRLNGGHGLGARFSEFHDAPDSGVYFLQEDYGIGLPTGSQLRKPLNSALLRLKSSGHYETIYKKNGLDQANSKLNPTMEVKVLSL